MFTELLNQIVRDPHCQIAINISGGKDSQAMLSFINRTYPDSNKFVIHAHLGRAEWAQTLPFIQQNTKEQNVDLVVVKAAKDPIDYFVQRYERLKEKGEEKDKPFWSDAKNRYCTSQSKIAPINKYLRRYSLILHCIGIRAEESRARSQKSPFKVRKDISSTVYQDLCPEAAFELWHKHPDKRLAFDYYPIFDWDLERVWNECGHTTADWNQRRSYSCDIQSTNGWKAHPAYVLSRGNERLSCAFCVLGSLNDLENAIAYNQETYQILCDLEKAWEWDFQKGRLLRDIQKRPQQLTLSF